ncbi:uncharacterized protein F4807DRAFT_464947 [Annulohypoxylon truncatum]|uniref:uncharacterized protein n=1 Tax=Annulohypoxylon truncatum TaxID=327061 RepID=UPI002008AD70|nr:uncharacterized protein F4807DRAFT_464947 [Annulohypoxylon truncatum]KAI1205127.1 hypothetical protein F4807DRAFT_464947 [Annulohypoxylon truncatum]
MDRLPQTILEKIIIFIADDADPMSRNAYKRAVAPYATVSSKFRLAVERITFSNLLLTIDNVPTASVILGQFSRWLYVRTVLFNIALPRYEGEAATRLESPEEKTENSLTFTTNITTLFQLLSEYPVHGASACGSLASFSLHIHVFSVTDKSLKGYSDQIFEQGTLNTDVGVEIWRYHRSLLHLDDSIILPSLQHVPIDKIEFPTIFYRRHIDSNSLARMISIMNLKRLKSVWWAFGDLEKRDLLLRRAQRQAFADAIDSLPNLDYFELINEYFTPHNHDYQPPILYHPRKEVDPVSCAIRRLCQRTKKLIIFGVLGSTELFWPKIRPNYAPEPYWESLEELRLTFHPLTPDGKWLFKRDEDETPQEIRYIDLCPEPDEIRGEEDDSWNLWRYAPSQDRMNEFYRVLGRALVNMPKLRYMILQSINYLSSPPGEERTQHQFIFEVYEDRKAKALWYSKPEYEPSDLVKKIWIKSAYELALDLEIFVISIPTEEEDDGDYENGDSSGDGHEEQTGDNDGNVITIIEIS